MADPRVVAEVEPGSSQPSGQLGQREILPEDNPRRGQPAQGTNGRSIGFASDDRQLHLGIGGEQFSGQLAPLFHRPVFCRTAGSGVQGNGQGLVYCRLEGESGGAAGQREAKSGEGRGELVDGVRRFARTMRSGYHALRPGILQVLGKDPVGIVEVAEDEVERCEISAEARVEHAAPGEEAGQRTVFDRAEGIDQAGRFGQRGDPRIREHLKTRVGRGFPQGVEHRKGEDKITEGTAADDQCTLERGRDHRLSSVSAHGGHLTAENAPAFPTGRTVPRDGAHAGAGGGGVLCAGAAGKSGKAARSQEGGEKEACHTRINRAGPGK